MILAAVLCIAISIGFIYGTAYGFLAFGALVFLIHVLQAVFRRIPVVRSTDK